MSPMRGDACELGWNPPVLPVRGDANEVVDTGDEYASNDGGVAAVVGGEAAVEEEEGLLHPDGEDSCGTKDSSGIGGDVECPECGKFFKNDKSLFGHLQSHPNRGYKGALLRL